MDRVKAGRVDRRRLLSLLLWPLVVVPVVMVFPFPDSLLSWKLFPSLYVYAQTGSKVRSINCDFVPEENCPVSVTARCNLDLDPFDAPMSSKIYLDYKNIGDRAISAVKFRVRFVDGEGKDRGTFHAVDATYLTPQAERSQKWKRDFTLHPQVVAMKIRVLQVKFAEGGDWQSVKMQELAGSGSGAAPGAADASQGGAEPGAEAP